MNQIYFRYVLFFICIIYLTYTNQVNTLAILGMLAGILFPTTHLMNGDEKNGKDNGVAIKYRNDRDQGGARIVGCV